MEITKEQLRIMSKGRPNTANMNSMLVALKALPEDHEIKLPQVLPHFLCQILHESGSFKWDKEIWGPTPAQKRYEGRKDLGNTQKGDGKKFMGRTPGQITGRANTTKFWKWCLSIASSLGLTESQVPNFVEDPDKMNTDPWEGLGPIWYWMVGNPEGKPLTHYALENNIDMITKRINGGKNGLADRTDYYGRCALVLLGYGVSPEEAKRFQKDHPEAGTPDGIVGQRTRMALHEALGGKNPYKKTVTTKVTEIEHTPVKVPTLDKPWYADIEGVKEVATTVGAPTILSFFTDIPTDKLLILGGFLAAGSIVWYLARRMKKKDQDEMVSAIKSAPNSVVTTETVVD